MRPLAVPDAENTVYYIQDEIRRTDGPDMNTDSTGRSSSSKE
jgi:hypothetical protein